MHLSPKDELRESYTSRDQDELLSNQDILRMKRKLAQEFCEQLVSGAQSNDDVSALLKFTDWKTFYAGKSFSCYGTMDNSGSKLLKNC
jgi:hypothetical protein